MENYMKLEVAALSENEGFTRSAVAAFALCLNPSFSELSDIKTAVSEAVTNSIVHAYDGGAAGRYILVECRAETTTVGGVLHITVTDGGRGIEDVERAVQPFFTTLENEERSGMGFTIMQSFMDGFTVDSRKDEGTRVTMWKRIGAELPCPMNAAKERMDA